MALLPSLVCVLFFWLALALNLVLLFLQLIYVPEEQRPKKVAIVYRLVLTFGFAGAFVWSLLDFIALATGWFLRNRSLVRREKILSWVESNSASKVADQRRENQEQGKSTTPKDVDWNGIVGFFHPFWYRRSP